MSSFPRGARLFSIGDHAESLYVVDEGAVELKLPLAFPGTTREITIDTIGPGQTVAWSALVPPYKLTLSAVTSVESRLICLPRSDLTAVFESVPRIGWKVMQNVAGVTARRLMLMQTVLVRQLQLLLERRLGLFPAADEKGED